MYGATPLATPNAYGETVLWWYGGTVGVWSKDGDLSYRR